MEKNETRKLTGWLFISGVLNILFVSFCFYWMTRERPPIPYFELKPANSNEQQTPFAIDHSNAEIIRYFKTLSQEQLIAKLSNAELVDNGYTIRDLSLASLVTFHHFDIFRALLDVSQPSQVRVIAYGCKKDGKPAKVTVYPGLSEKQYEGIMRFAARERWPMTSKGLFLSLKNPKTKQVTSLADAFYLTPEFLSAEMLFSRLDTSVSKQEILNVLLSGPFGLLSQFTEQQRQSQDLTAARRQHFLLEYVKKQSKEAAYLFLKTDGPQIVRKLDDANIQMILVLLTEKTVDAGKFALALLTSPRGDAVWQMAAKRLYEYAEEDLPENFEHQLALLRFLPANMSVKKQEPQQEEIEVKETTSKKNNTLYIIQEGDSLWKISRRFDVDIDLLKQHNHLSSDFLKPGGSLKIP